MGATGWGKTRGKPIFQNGAGAQKPDGLKMALKGKGDKIRKF